MNKKKKDKLNQLISYTERILKSIEDNKSSYDQLEYHIRVINGFIKAESKV